MPPIAPAKSVRPRRINPSLAASPLNRTNRQTFTPIPKRVPLSPQAVAIIQSLPRISDRFAFSLNAEAAATAASVASTTRLEISRPKASCSGLSRYYYCSLSRFELPWILLKSQQFSEAWKFVWYYADGAFKRSINVARNAY